MPKNDLLSVHVPNIKNKDNSENILVIKKKEKVEEQKL